MSSTGSMELSGVYYEIAENIIREVIPTYATQIVKTYILKAKKIRSISRAKKKGGGRRERAPVLNVNWPNFSNE